MRHTPSTAFHIHIKDPTVTVDLFRRSETLWFLPPLESSLCAPKIFELPSYLLFASDHTVLPLWRLGRGEGAFKSNENVVLVSKAHILLQAYMRLYARDQGTLAGSFGISMITYIWSYVDKDGYLDITQLLEPFKTLYEDLKKGTEPVRLFLDELREALGVLESKVESNIQPVDYRLPSCSYVAVLVNRRHIDRLFLAPFIRYGVNQRSERWSQKQCRFTLSSGGVVRISGMDEGI